VAFLFSSHDPRIVERAERRIQLLDGRIVADDRAPVGARA
jgi:ABC-type lipoprotein export system ATPase subunit